LGFTIALAASGDLDTTFSGDGKQIADVNVAHPGWDDRIFAMAIQSNGKIVAVGYSSDNSTDSNIAVARYNSNGSPDTTFSGDGRQITNLGGWDKAYGLAIQSDGKIVVVGTRFNDGTLTTGYLAVVRYNPNGTLDTTFNGTGRKFVGNAGSSGGVAIQADGKIVVGAGVSNGTDGDFAVFRFNYNGSLDTTFSGDGKQTIGFGAGIEDTVGWGQNLAIQPDGRIVMGGGSGNNFAVVRLYSNGTLDTTFSGDGRQTTNFGGDDHSRALALQPDGRIVAVGHKGTAGNSYFAVARYNSDGSPDTTFNVTGRKIIDFVGSADELAFAVAIESNGKILVAGDVQTNILDFAVVRLNSNGSLDTTFSGDGKATVDFGNYDRCRALAIDGSGKYVLAGLTSTGGVLGDFALARMLP
jgi:uncharacterized delta-60 repeat protein